jgi:FeS assembly SUF system protein
MTDTAEAKNLDVKHLDVKHPGVGTPDVGDPEVKSSHVETSSALPPEETERLSGEIVAALKTVFDPEIPADIYELGLIYKVDLKDDRAVDVLMTLTTPNCPAAGELPTQVENAVASVPGVGVVSVSVVWDPPWSPERMSDEARLVLNMW